MIYDRKPNLVAISNYMRNYAIQSFKQKGYDVECRFVHNGIDLNKYTFDPNIKKSENLLFVGRFSSFKRPEWAIEIAKRVGHEIDLIGGTFVDNLNYLSRIESMCDSINTGIGKIRMYKDVTHEFKIEKMQSAKALIFPSNMGEPFGLVALEAMACGTPVIATRDGAIGEVVIHNHTGFICDNIPDMIEAIKNIHTIDPKNCRKRAEELSRQVMAKNYEKLYRDIIAGNEW